MRNAYLSIEQYTNKEGHNKQRVTVFIYLLCLIFALTGCSSKPVSATKDNQNTPVATHNADIVENETNVPSIDIYSISWKSTPSSTCFSKIGFDQKNHVLGVTFRDSGESYIYYNFSQTAWDNFNSASSLGSWFNSEIKGSYEYIRLD